MPSRFSWSLFAFTAFALFTPFIGANELMGPLHHHHGQCSKCQVVEEIVYQDVVVQRCKIVPDNKPIKKTVYEIKEVPVCQKKLPCFGHCDDCPECECCARTKRVLIKKEIVCGEKEGTKCVTEDVIERVPVRVQRVIPCQSCQSNCPACQAARLPQPIADLPVARTATLPKVKTAVPPVVVEDPSAPSLYVPTVTR